MVEDRLKTAKNSIGFVIVFVSIVSNFRIVQCGPSAQQEHELLLLDALSRKQISTNLNSIASNNYESNAIMDMLGRSMLSQQNQKSECFHFRFLLITWLWQRTLSCGYFTSVTRSYTMTTWWKVSSWKQLAFYHFTMLRNTQSYMLYENLSFQLKHKNESSSALKWKKCSFSHSPTHEKSVGCKKRLFGSF